jgi:hypothetical protein
MTFISIHSVIIYVVFFGACMRCTRLCPLNPGVTYRGLAIPLAGDGKTFFLWNDVCNNSLLAIDFLWMFTFSRN